jgi:hypothetical protein
MVGTIKENKKDAAFIYWTFDKDGRAGGEVRVRPGTQARKRREGRWRPIEPMMHATLHSLPHCLAEKRDVPALTHTYTLILIIHSTYT